MANIYSRSVNGIKVRLGKYSDYEFVIYIGNKMYAMLDNLADAYREYNSVSKSTLQYLGY